MGVVSEADLAEHAAPEQVVKVVGASAPTDPAVVGFGRRSGCGSDGGRAGMHQGVDTPAPAASPDKRASLMGVLAQPRS